MDVEGTEIFMYKVASTMASKNGVAWFKESDLLISLIEKYRSQKIPQNQSLAYICNTDKTKVYTRELKTLTCGLNLICTNCGIIVGVKELLGAESCTQVATHLIEVKENFNTKG